MDCNEEYLIMLTCHAPNASCSVPTATLPPTVCVTVCFSWYSEVDVRDNHTRITATSSNSVLK